MIPAEPAAESPQRQQGQPRAEPVDAVDQVVRIGQQNDHQHRQQRAHSRRHMVQAEQSAQILDSHTAVNQQHADQYLRHELRLVGETAQVVGQTDEEKQRSARYDEKQLLKRRRLDRRRGYGQPLIIAHAQQQSHRKKERREERDPSQTGYVSMVGLARGKLVEKLFLFRDQDNLGYGQPSGQSRNDESQDDENFQFH